MDSVVPFVLASGLLSFVDVLALREVSASARRETNEPWQVLRMACAADGVNEAAVALLRWLQTAPCGRCAAMARTLVLQLPEAPWPATSAAVADSRLPQLVAAMPRCRDLRADGMPLNSAHVNALLDASSGLQLHNVAVASVTGATAERFARLHDVDLVVNLRAGVRTTDTMQADLDALARGYGLLRERATSLRLVNFANTVRDSFAGLHEWPPKDIEPCRGADVVPRFPNVTRAAVYKRCWEVEVEGWGAELPCAPRVLVLEYPSLVTHFKGTPARDMLSSFKNPMTNAMHALPASVEVVRVIDLRNTSKKLKDWFSQHERQLWPKPVEFIVLGGAQAKRASEFVNRIKLMQPAPAMRVTVVPNSVGGVAVP